MKASRFGVIFALALLFMLGDRAEGCTCMPPGPPCQSYWGASAVFTGVVTNVSTTEPQDGRSFQLRIFRFSVEQAYRGVEGAEVEIFTGMTDAECGYYFVTGQKYLVYAHRAATDNRLHTNICTRTRPVADAADDLEFIKGLSRAESGGRVFGTVKRYASELKDGHRTLVPVKSVKVIVEAENQRFKATTDNQGRYQLTGLDPGTYSVRPAYPKKFNPAAGFKVEVSDRGCAEANFIAEPVR